jgi:hypothetical protein
VNTKRGPNSLVMPDWDWSILDRVSPVVTGAIGRRVWAGWNLVVSRAVGRAKVVVAREVRR